MHIPSHTHSCFGLCRLVHSQPHTQAHSLPLYVQALTAEHPGAPTTIPPPPTSTPTSKRTYCHHIKQTYGSIHHHLISKSIYHYQKVKAHSKAFISIVGRPSRTSHTFRLAITPKWLYFERISSYTVYERLGLKLWFLV